MKELTKAEEQIMQILWKIKQGFVKEIIEKMDSPKPAYNTVSTIVRILEKKGFVDHKTYGKSHQYYPLISKEKYRKKYFNSFVKGYFGNSYNQLVSFFSKDDNLSVEEMDEMIKIIQEQRDIKKNA